MTDEPLDNALWDALKANDIEATFITLQAGANPNAPAPVGTGSSSSLSMPYPVVNQSLLDTVSGLESWARDWKSTVLLWEAPSFPERLQQCNDRIFRRKPILVPNAAYNALHLLFERHHTYQGRYWPPENVSLLKLLLQHHADVNVRDPRGATPLIYAASMSCNESIGLLIGYGADVNAQDNAGLTALMWSILCSEEETIHVLLNNRANINQKCHIGWSALSYAGFLNSSAGKERIKLLKQAGAKE